MKYSIVQLLKDAAPSFISGGEIAKQFRVTRAAVWKCIEELRNEGYVIEAATRKGYRLLSLHDGLNEYEIKNGLNTSIVGSDVVYLDSIDSTNSYAKKLAQAGAIDGTVVIAAEQTTGRGRLGRSWESPLDKGIYISVLLRPAIEPSETPILTLAAAVAVSKAISEATGISTGIKWPNDLVVEGKKVCGILLEMSAEADRVSNIILGIGINYSQTAEDLPTELRDRAISLKAVSGESALYSKLSIIRSVLRELDNVLRLILNDDNEAEVLDMWRERSVTLGRQVGFTLKNIEYTGVAVDITRDGRLSVECSDGARRELLSGEVSVRGIYGYV